MHNHGKPVFKTAILTGRGRRLKKHDGVKQNLEQIRYMFAEH